MIACSRLQCLLPALAWWELCAGPLILDLFRFGNYVWRMIILPLPNPSTYSRYQQVQDNQQRRRRVLVRVVAESPPPHPLLCPSTPSDDEMRCYRPDNFLTLFLFGMILGREAQTPNGNRWTLITPENGLVGPKELHGPPSILVPRPGQPAKCFTR